MRVRFQDNSTSRAPVRRGVGLALVVLCLAAGACQRNETLTGTVSAALAHGWDSLRLAEYERALPAFEQAVAGAMPGSEDAASALYSLGCYWNLRRPDADRPRAAVLFGQVIAAHAESPWAGWSALAIARQYQLDAIEALPDPVKLDAGYREVIARYPQHPAATEALLFIQLARLVRADDASALAVVAEMEAFVRDHADSPYIPMAWSLLAQGYFLRHQGPQRVHALIRAWETTSAKAVGDIERDPVLTYFVIATAAQFDVGDFATARRFYRMLIDEYPTEQKAFVAKQQLRNMDEIEARILKEMALPATTTNGGGAP